MGDVYRTENAPGFVFEEVTVRSTDETLDGPLGPIRGGMLADELHSDGKTEQKVFAPGYGEFYTAGGGDVGALAPKGWRCRNRRISTSSSWISSFRR